MLCNIMILFTDSKCFTPTPICALSALFIYAFYTLRNTALQAQKHIQ